ncbi:small cysteine-rich protein 8-like [Oculina patagonica]
MFHLCLLMIILGTITVQGAHPGHHKENTKHVHDKEEKSPGNQTMLVHAGESPCKLNSGWCVQPWYECGSYGGQWCSYSCPSSFKCCCW